MTRFAILTAAVVLCAGVAGADHDIAVPYQAPQGAATIDGDLSDWAAADWIALDEVYAGGPTDVTGARYSLRWSDAANRLYFAVEVVDTQQNLQPGYLAWNLQDDVEISVDAGNNGVNFTNTMTKGQQIMFGAAPDGSDWAVASWMHTVGTDLVPEFAAAVNGDVISYEGAIVPYSHYSAWSGDADQALVDLQVGTLLGLDVVAVTMLNDYSYGMLTNNLVLGKFNKGQSLQKWELVPEPASMSLLGLGALALIRRRR